MLCYNTRSSMSIKLPYYDLKTMDSKLRQVCGRFCYATHGFVNLVPASRCGALDNGHLICADDTFDNSDWIQGGFRSRNDIDQYRSVAPNHSQPKFPRAVASIL